MNIPSMPIKNHQQGFIAFAILTLIIASASAAVLSTFSVSIQSHYNAKKDYDQLQQIRESLIAFATIPQTSPTDPLWRWTPGRLPCPDLNHDGLSDTTLGSCTSNNTTVQGLGWLPYKTLKLPDLRDSSNEHFWYQVTYDYANSPAVINHTLPALALSSIASSEKDTIAVVIAPGKPLEHQTYRYPLSHICPSSCAHPTKYLEGGNQDNNVATIEKRLEDNENFNDLVIAIKPKDLWPRVEHAVLKETRQALMQSKSCFNPINPTFPRPAPASALLVPALQVDPSATFGKVPVGSTLWQSCLKISPEFKLSGWFVRSGWHNAIFYAHDTNQLKWIHNGLTDSDAKSALLISAGFDIDAASNPRPNAILSDYLEHGNAVLDEAYESESPFKDYTHFNDLIEIVE